MAAANHEALHFLAKQYLPTVQGELEQHIKAKSKNLVIAIERHDKDDACWQTGWAKDRFLWIKGREKLTLRSIHEAYMKQCANPELPVVLSYASAYPDPETMVGALDTFADGLIVLRAEQRSDIPSQQQPLQPPIRSPLQPVNRQFNVAIPATNQDLKPAPSLRSELRSPISLHNSTPSPFPPLADRPSATPTPAVKADPTIKHELVEDHVLATYQLPTTQSASRKHEPDENENPFISQEGDVDPSTRGQSLRQLAQTQLPERLEAGVRAGIDVLATVRQPLERLGGNADAQDWLEQIEKVRKEAVKTRTVVGVVGNTGAGKSSVINAMLDEERLVPTNCMRACTAVVTELSYNDSTSENSRYRAEIEFIKPEDWRRELTILFREVFDESGHVSREVSNPDSQAGIAYAKILAVYHRHTKEMLSKATVDSLMAVKQVASVLGTTRKIVEPRPDSFYRRLQTYVDSKEKGAEKLNKNGDKISNPRREFEHWPLIKVVKIYTKSDALSTGAVIVDLPGVHDSNAARAAVAEGYMKQCTALWIVAPINRAVDDKAAKTLLGNTFKRQLKYDGTYSAVTFICSKTDDISKTEAADSLQLGGEMEELDAKLAKLDKQRRELQSQLKSIRGQKDDYAETIDAIEEQIEKWDELRDRLEDGKTVYAPSDKKTKKRKRSSPFAAPRKRTRRMVDSDDDEDYREDSPAASQSKSTETDEADQATPLTKDDIEQKLKELQKLKKEARRERSAIEDQLRELRDQIREVEEKGAEFDARQDELCIAGRNDYSRSAIRQDFAAGIKELDQENAEEENPDDFDPEIDIRDYDEVERSLPVFCVSSRAYQKLCGRMQKDNDVPGFTDMNQTEIPQLQAHCKKLTENGRLANCRRFLNSLDQLLASLSLWASDDGSGMKLTDQQRTQEYQFLDRKLKELEKALQTDVIDKLDDVTSTLNEQLFDKFRPAILSAATQAVPTSTKWGAHRDDGGLHFSTYRATVRRSGVFSGASGPQDFNQQLFDPVQKQLASGWEKSFHRRLPTILSGFQRSGTTLLQKFHSAIETRCKERGHGIGRISLLANQLNAYSTTIKDIIDTTVAAINEGQRDINREFTPVITACMEPAYELCGAESGTGCYKRMKTHMVGHVESEKEAMFHRACEQVRHSLAALVERVRKEMLDRVDAVYVAMRRDYLSVVGGVDVKPVQLPREGRMGRHEVDEALARVDRTFRAVLECEIEGLGDFGTALAEEGGAEADGVDADEPSGIDEDEQDVETETEASGEESENGRSETGDDDEGYGEGYEKAEAE